MKKNSSAADKKCAIIVDINKHGIRRERYAAGYKAVKKLSKKLKGNK